MARGATRVVQDVAGEIQTSSSICFQITMIPSPQIYLVNMIAVKVECYAGYKGSERPLRFTLGSHVIEVEAVEDQWHSPDITYFRIRGNDGKTYILKHREGQDLWTLEVYSL